MIKIEFSLAIALYLVLIICIIFICWIIIESRKDRPGLFSSERDFFWQCDTCTYLYVDSKHAVISQCPRCGSYNKKEETLNKDAP